MCSLMDLSFASGMRKHESMRVRESEWDGARWQRAVTGSPSKFRLATTLKVASANQAPASETSTPRAALARASTAEFCYRIM